MKLGFIRNRITIIFLLYFASAWSQFVNPSLFNAQCKANCVRYFSNLNTDEIPDHWSKWINKEDLVENFRRNREDYARECFTKCDQQMATGPQGSPKCSDQNYGCWLGEIFFKQSVQKRPGTCPTFSLNDQAIGERILSCKDSCISDEDCTDPMFKCCNVGCKKECSLAKQDSRDIPEIPQPPVIVRSKEQMEIQITPGPGLEGKTDVIYVIQARSCECYTMDSASVSKWNTIHMMEHLKVEIGLLPRGQMIQFRIAAVNSNGSKGFSDASLPFPEKPIMPNVPEKPGNVTEAQWKYESNYKVEILLRWEPPVQSDLQVREYNITWVRDDDLSQSDGKILPSATIYQKTIPAAKTECILDNLNPGSRYRVHLVAIAYWHGYGLLKSKPCVYFIQPNDPYISKARPSLNSELQQRGFMEDSCDCNRNISDRKFPVIIHEPEYDRNKLSVQVTVNDFTRSVRGYFVQWTPTVCIESEENQNLNNDLIVQSRMQREFISRSFRLTNLKFQCKYLVNITRIDLNPTSRFTSKSTCFCTKACSKTHIAHGSPLPICRNNLRSPPPRPILAKEELIDKRNGHYLVSWKIDPYSLAQNDHSQTALDQKDRIKFRVTWGPRIYEPIDEKMYDSGFNFFPLLDERRSQVKVINMENDNKIFLQNLKPETVYLVKIQTLLFTESGEELESPVETIFFTTKGKKSGSNMGRQGSFGSRSSSSIYLIILLLMARIMIIRDP